MINAGQIDLGAIKIKTLYSCPPAVSVGKAVYQTGSGTADTADSTGPAPLGPSIGVVDSKPSPTECYVVQQGIVDGFPPGTFIPQETLFLGAAGAIVRAALLPGVAGSMVQEVGYAKTDTVAMIVLDRDFYTI
jgi:hypothetical protein